ncbi:MAG: serine hydrolase [Woeseiaceae bacterium]
MNTSYLKAFATAWLIASASALADDTSSQLDQLMHRYSDLGQFNGVALVVDGGSTVLRKGYGSANLEWQVENTPETRFLVGSVTKSFTALVIMQLAERGALELDAPIVDYLPAYREDTGSAITIRHLLTHTDGIPNYTKNTYFWQSNSNGVPITTAEFVAQYCSGDVEFAPGSQYRYGNSGYSVLGAIIERVTGKPYDEVVAQQILQPLGMQNTGQYRDDTVLDSRATGYEIAIDGFRHAAPIPKPFFAAGSMYSTVDDLVRYDRALQGAVLISDAGRKMMFDSRDGAVAGTFAFGWSVGEATLGGAIPGRQYIATNGQINGFNAIVVRIPRDEHLIILLNNTGETDLFSMTDNIMRVIYGLAANKVESRLRDVFFQKLREASLDAALAFYRERRDDHSTDYLYFPWPMRILAGQLMSDGRYDDAISILNLNLETNPNDAKSFEALGDAYSRVGDVKTANANYRRALLLDNLNAYAADKLANQEE